MDEEGGLRITQVYIGEFKGCIPVGGGGSKKFQRLLIPRVKQLQLFQD